jgi:hypothetical protein
MRVGRVPGEMEDPGFPDRPRFFVIRMKISEK